MSGVVARAKQWLVGDKVDPGSIEITGHYIIENLLAEIHRIEGVTEKMAADIKRLKTEGVEDARRAVAEECAVICETADYVVRSYGCAREIRVKFGLPTQKL
ncbi:MAG: hypothetical protein PHP95_13665 [Desulfuromonadaceae bacterium]|nr:hypothetical protein [Desulfuromonadaceae bacterium]MDD2849495.1 hypothetical protein [Desulfuromonadaceae bacterium]MDD4130491.1 hypothetical protein [Desulfuromonadaceae bacterium]